MLSELFWWSTECLTYNLLGFSLFNQICLFAVDPYWTPIGQTLYCSFQETLAGCQRIRDFSTKVQYFPLEKSPTIFWETLVLSFPCISSLSSFSETNWHFSLTFLEKNIYIETMQIKIHRQKLVTFTVWYRPDIFMPPVGILPVWWLILSFLHHPSRPAQLNTAA